MSIQTKLRQRILAYPKRAQEGMLWLILLLVPLVVGLAWDTCDDSAYITLRLARNLAVGRNLTYGLTAAGQTWPGSPLYALALALPTRLGGPLPSAGLILSALGWGATAIAVYGVGRAMRRPIAAVISAGLVAFNPVVVSTLGAEISWTVALAWLAVGLSIRKRWNAQIVIVALMLCAHFDLSTLGLAALLFAIQWIERRHLPLRAGLILTIVALGCGLIAAWQIGVPLSLSRPFEIAPFKSQISGLLGESEFYWLFLPIVGLGLFAEVGSRSTTRSLQFGALLWAASSILSGGAAAWAVMVTVGLLLTGLGIEWAVRWIEARDLVRLEPVALTLGVTLVATLPLGIAQVSSLVQRYQFRPVIRQQLEQQAGSWLNAHSEPTATVFGPEQVGFWADRSTLPWDEPKIEQAGEASLLEILSKNPPTYCVSFKSLAWDRLMRTGWFRDRYAPVLSFDSPYDAGSPLTIWGYRSSAFDVNERRPLNVHLPSQVELIDWKAWPDRIQPGDAVYVTLFLQATRPVTRSLRAVVRLISPADGVGWAQRDAIVPRSIPVDWWRTGQEIAERFVLTTTAEVPVGGYLLDVSVLTPDATNFLPIFQDDNPGPFDQITLGYVAVPWTSKPDIPKPINAKFEDHIKLLGFDAPDNLAPGNELDVTLFWEAEQAPQDNYVVFVHLLDADGQLVANHDGSPMDGRYPTKAWLPGDVVSDTHRIMLGPDIPVGTYRLQVGVYRWPSLERLAVWDNQGAEQADRVLVLQSIQVVASQ